MNKLVFSDVKCNEIFYHGKCLKKLDWDYKQATKEVKEKNATESWAKAYAFEKVVAYLYEQSWDEPGTIFEVKNLEKIYIDELATQGIQVASHTTNFAKKLTDSIEGLVKKSIDKVQCTVTFEETVDHLYWNHMKSPQTFVSQLRSVVERVREDIFEKEYKFDGQFDDDSQMKSVPTTLLTLVSYLIHGECESNYSQHTVYCTNDYIQQ